jgi:hypothetical protein
MRLDGNPNLLAPLPQRPRGRWRKRYERLLAEARLAAEPLSGMILQALVQGMDRGGSR